VKSFIRIKSYIINLDNLAYATIAADHIDFSFALPGDRADAPGHIRLTKGVDLPVGDFQEVMDFVLQLPDPDRVIVI
jgi:hypothetical protein